MNKSLLFSHNFTVIIFFFFDYKKVTITFSKITFLKFSYNLVLFDQDTFALKSQIYFRNISRIK